MSWWWRMWRHSYDITWQHDADVTKSTNNVTTSLNELMTLHGRPWRLPMTPWTRGKGWGRKESDDVMVVWLQLTQGARSGVTSGVQSEGSRWRQLNPELSLLGEMYLPGYISVGIQLSEAPLANHLHHHYLPILLTLRHCESYIPSTECTVLYGWRHQLSGEWLAN